MSAAKSLDPAKLVNVMSRFRNESAYFTITQAMIFFFVAANPGISQRKVWETFKFSDSTASRALGSLADVVVRGRQPMNLVKSIIGENRRDRILSLTPKGERLLADIARDLGF